MYNKLFTRILDSSIWLEDSDTRIVWIMLLAVMDQDGFCRFASPANIARRARVSPAAAVAALQEVRGTGPAQSRGRELRTPHRARSGRLHRPQRHQASETTDPRGDTEAGCRESKAVSREEA